MFKIKCIFFGLFDPVNIFLIIKMNNFGGDPSDISAKMATLFTGAAVPQSVLRKLSRFGLLGLRKVFVTLLRGNLLQRCAELTIDVAVRIPLRVHATKPRQRSLYIARSVTAEVALTAARALACAASPIPPPFITRMRCHCCCRLSGVVGPKPVPLVS